MSLLLNKPPGREAFPGDIFYVHSRLLERSAKLSANLGGGSLTALPIVETLQGDLASYIPTNLISITDGQLYLDADVFKKGVIPALDFSLSVSRVGSKAQIEILKELSKNFLSQIKKYRQLELFASFGSDIDAETRHHLNRGARAIEMIKQRYLYYGIEEQVFCMFTILDGF
jgi:F-type H+-transporting ATPase subunit alpha